MTFYAEMADVAVEMLAEFGQSVVLGSVTGTGAYDPETGTVGNTVTNHSGMGVALDYEQKDIDGTVVKQGDRRIYIAPDLGAVPKTGDTLTLADGAVLAVVNSKPLSPAGTLVLHEVQARGV